MLHYNPITNKITWKKVVDANVDISNATPDVSCISYWDANN